MCPESAETLIDLLDSHVPKDLKVVSSSPENLFFQHRAKDGQDYYWLVNDSNRTRTSRLLFSTPGIPEKWDALTGQRSAVFYVNRPGGTEVAYFGHQYGSQCPRRRSIAQHPFED